MTYISWSSDFSFFALEIILVSLAKPHSGELRCPATALIKLKFLVKIKIAFELIFFSRSFFVISCK